MHRFTVTIETGNAAFCDEQTGEPTPEARNRELALILRVLADRLEEGTVGPCRNLYDTNGNPVGVAQLTRTRR
jgi:hypothetical protein